MIEKINAEMLGSEIEYIPKFRHTNTNPYLWIKLNCNIRKVAISYFDEDCIECVTLGIKGSNDIQSFIKTLENTLNVAKKILQLDAEQVEAGKEVQYD